MASSSDDDDDSQMDMLTETMQALNVSGTDTNQELSALEKHSILLNHIILPHFLPQSTTPHYHQSELQLLTEMTANIFDLRKYIPPQTVALFNSMNEIVQELKPANISEKINALQPGDTFAMFVRRQNCAFIIHAPSNENVFNGRPENVIVATFPGRLHPKEVYECNSDIEVTIESVIRSFCRFFF